MKKLIILVLLFFATVGNASANHIVILSVIVEGFYNASTNKCSRSDTVYLYVCQDFSPYAALDSSPVRIDSITFTGFSQGLDIINWDYFIVVKHRNSLETWSAWTQIGGSHTTYNFTTAANKAYGSNMIQVDASPVRFAIYSGDVNQDDAIDGTDVSIVDNDASNFVMGFVLTDLNYDGVVDASDVAIVDNNASNFVTIVRP